MYNFLVMLWHSLPPNVVVFCGSSGCCCFDAILVVLATHATCIE